MLTLVIAVAVGTLLAVFATQNTGLVTLNFANYSFNIPVYLAVLTPLVAALFIAYFIYILRNLSQNLTLHEQTDKVRKLKSELAILQKSAHKLQVENLKLKKDLGLPKDGFSI